MSTFDELYAKKIGDSIYFEQVLHEDEQCELSRIIADRKRLRESMCVDSRWRFSRPSNDENWTINSICEGEIEEAPVAKGVITLTGLNRKNLEAYELNDILSQVDELEPKSAKQIIISKKRIVETPWDSRWDYEFKINIDSMEFWSRFSMRWIAVGKIFLVVTIITFCPYGIAPLRLDDEGILSVVNGVSF